MKCLNLGCGYRFHAAWTNINFVSTGEGVIAHNLTQGIPFPDASFDIVYHSHLLEHFPKQVAVFFMKECCRVLRPKGVLRVVVPDLEQITRTYITALEKANSGFPEWASNYDWILLHLYDQTVRNHSGGEMATYLSREDLDNEEFVLQLCGIEAKNLIEVSRKNSASNQFSALQNHQFILLLKRIYHFIRYSNYRRELLLKILLGKEYKALQIGRFRQSGEVHQWMYDRYSLGLLLENCGLQNIVKRTATESYIPDWANFNLDTEPDGTVYRPDSLFMEAIKPLI